MEGGQKTTIALDSALDINSADMLVPVGQPKFTFNRQKYQGSLLQTSYRYEADGWFAGWWGHNFDFEDTTNNYVVPALDDNAELTIRKKTTSYSSVVYQVIHKDTGLVYTFNPKLYVNWQQGSGTVTRINDSVTRVTGVTTAGSTFTANVDSYTGAIISFTTSDTSLVADGSSLGDTLLLYIEPDPAIDNSLTIRRNNQLIASEDLFKVDRYTRTATESNWGDLFKMADATLTPVAIEPEFQVITSTVSGAGTTTEQTLVQFKDISPCAVTWSFDFSAFWTADMFKSVKVVNPYIDDTQAEPSGYYMYHTPESAQFAQKIWNLNNNLVYNNELIYAQGLPIWIQQQIPFEYYLEWWEPPIPEPIEYDYIFQSYIVTKSGDTRYVNVTRNIIDSIDIYSYITQAPVAHDPVDKQGSVYTVHVASNPRYSVLTLSFSATEAGLLIGDSWQPYLYVRDPTWDPRPTIYNGTDPDSTTAYPKGCMPNPDYHGGVASTWNEAKYESAKTAYDDAAIIAIPDYIAIADPEPLYIIDPATAGGTVSNARYQPNPFLPDYDPRPVAVSDSIYNIPRYPWTDMSMANPTENTTSQYMSVTPNYLRYWLGSEYIQEADWLTAVDRVYWETYWPTRPKYVLPTNGGLTPNPYDIPELKFEWSRDPTLDPYYINELDAWEHSPPQERPYAGTLYLNWQPHVAWIHALLDISAETEWEWALNLTRRVQQFQTDAAGNVTPVSSVIEYYDSYGTREYIPTVRWRSSAENFAFMVHNRNIASINKLLSESEALWRNDTWVLQLRCKNLQVEFPIPVGASGDGSNYFKLSLTCNGRFADDDNLNFLQLSPVRIITWGSYPAMPYSNNYNPLNKGRWAQYTVDDQLFYSDDHDAKITIPICVYAYAVSRITTPNIIASNASAFAFVPNVPSASIPNGTKLFRIDGVPYGIDMVRTSFVSIQQDTSSTDQIMTVALEGIGNVPVPVYAMSGTAPCYPVWMVDPYATVYTEATSYKTVDVTAKQMSAQIQIGIELTDFITAITGAKAFTLSAYNGNLFNALDLHVDEIVVPPPMSVLPSKTQSFRVWLDATSYVTFEYNASVGVTNVQNIVPAVTLPWEYINYTVKTRNAKYKATDLIVNIRNGTLFEAIFKRTFIVARAGSLTGAAIVSQTGDMVTLSPGYGKVDVVSGELIGATSVTYSRSEVDGDIVKVFVVSPNFARVLFSPPGFTAINNPGIEYVSFTATPTQYIVQFTYNGTPHTLYIDISTTAKKALSYTCTDIRTGEKKEVYSRDVSDVMMAVKQFWSNTTDIENYWWIDSQHVLELSKDMVTLYKKRGVGDVHDWNGDNWEIEEQGRRSDWLGTDDLYYSATSAHNRSAVFFTLRNSANAGVELRFLDPLTANYTAPVWQSVVIPVEGNIAFGTALRTNAISGYCYLNVAALITITKISSTVVGNYLLLGIKQNNGLAQWAVKVTLSTRAFSVLTGYGCVGPKGELTGGQLPKEYCDGTKGLTTAVRPLSVLRSADVSPGLGNGGGTKSRSFTNNWGPVGTKSQVWFVTSNLSGIVTHLTFNGTTWMPVIAPMPQNQVARMVMCGCHTTRLQDLIPQAINIADLLPGTGEAIKLVFSIISPNIFLLDLLCTFFAAAQSSYGCYAYVYRNSTSTPLPDDSMTLDKSFVFQKAVYVNNQNISGTKVHIFGTVMSHMLSQVYEAGANVAQGTINTPQGQQAVNDGGKKYTSFFNDLVQQTVSAAVNSAGLGVQVTDTCVHELTLDYFYSISDKEECHAGPGFVNHNFKAQVMAQSSSAVHIEAKQLGYFTPLIELTEIILNQQIKIADITITLLEGLVPAVAGISIGALGTTVNVGAMLSMPLQATLQTLMQARALLLAIQPYIKPLAERILGPTMAYTKQVLSTHVPEVEGIHTYGNKSVSLFWPAFGLDKPNTFTAESVAILHEERVTNISLSGKTLTFIPVESVGFGIDSDDTYFNPFYQTAGEPVLRGSLETMGTQLAKVKAVPNVVTMPDNMAVIEGVQTFMGVDGVKNEQIGVRSAVFGPPMIHDFMIDSAWQLGYTAGAGEIISVSCDDIKIMDGGPSNVVLSAAFCGVASPYVVVELKDSFDPDYLRPFLATTNSIGLNINRINCVHDAKAYHAFDGQVNRITNWVGGSGMDKELLYQQYVFQMNDHFKRSNIFPPAQFYGAFEGPPSLAIRSYEIVSNTIVEQTSGFGFGTNTPGENRNLMRFSLPVFFETLSSLPTVIRTLGPYKLRIDDGVTGLVTELRNTNTRYKAPTSIDFNINTELYRQTEEYITEVTTKSGVVMTATRVPAAGLRFLGPTMSVAYFYSPATKLYYQYTGGTDIQKQDILNRFSDVISGRWDFINQEVIFNAQLGHTAEDVILRLDGSVRGEVWPPNKTIYNDRSGFKTYSCAGGLVFQGPKRFIVSRFIPLEHMMPDIKANRGKWVKARREAFEPNRNYNWEYDTWTTTDTPDDAVFGWTHNPFLLVTSMLGTDEEVDNKFEWALTFAWTDVMDHVFDTYDYVTVNIMAETATQGGLVRQRPSHIFLYKELFTRSNNTGFYTYKFQSNNGIGNRERLYIWSDGIIALEDIKLDVKQMTSARTQPLVTQIDLERHTEL